MVLTGLMQGDKDAVGQDHLLDLISSSKGSATKDDAPAKAKGRTAAAPAKAAAKPGKK